MDKYLWVSERDVQDVISSFIAYTDKPDYMCDHITFNYKNLGFEEYKFTLCFTYAWNRTSYQPEPIKGIIRKTTRGCKIEAHKVQWLTIIDSIFIIAVLILGYFVAITEVIAGFEGSIVVSIMFGLLMTGMLTRFLYTRKKWKSKNILLDLIDRVASAERQNSY